MKAQPVYRPLTPDKKIAFQVERPLSELLPPLVQEEETQQGRKPALGQRTYLAMGIAGVFVAFILVALALGGRQAVPMPQPTAHATLAPTGIPQPTPFISGLPRAVVAYAAPEGVVLGSIEQGRPYTATARLDQEWTQIEAPGSGRVWIRASDLAPAVSLPNLATPIPQPRPQAPPQAPVVVSQPAPQPTQCAVVAGGGVTTSKCGVAAIEELDAAARQEWQEKWKGNQVSIATTTPWR